MRRISPVFQGISFGSRDAEKAILPLRKLRNTHELHDEVEFIGSLKGVSETNKERMIDMLQNNLFGLSVLDLILFDYIVLVD